MSSINSKLWENYEKFGRARGRLVAAILSQHVNLSRSNILDFGCGQGGVSIELAAAGARVTALDQNQEKIGHLRNVAQQRQLPVNIVHEIPLHQCDFDAVILLDVIEHLLDPPMILRQLYSLLKPGGLVYLSTPNKLSPINVFCDPHFSLPLVSLLARKNVKRVMAGWLKWQPEERTDFPELFSLKELDRLLWRAGFDWQFVSSRVAAYALQNPESVWNRDLHLALVEFVKKIGADRLVQKVVSDKIDLFNNLLNPTWYIMAQKTPDSCAEIGR